MDDIDFKNQVIEIHNDTIAAKEALKPIFHRLLSADLEDAEHLVGDAMCTLDEAVGTLREWLKENGVEVE